MTVLGLVATALVPLAGFAGFFLADREVRPRVRSRGVKAAPQNRPAAAPIVPANDVAEAPVAPEGPARTIRPQMLTPQPLVAD